MKTFRVFLISLFIAAAILVVVGGVAAIALAKPNGAAQSQAQPDVQATVQVYQQREAQYNQLIQQANQQLEQANSELQALQEKAKPVQQADPAQAPAPSVISPDQADQIASQAAGTGQVPLKSPDLVSFQGKTAYEVVFGKGSIYVDAQTGQVLYNGTVPPQVTADQAEQIAIAYLHNPNVLSVDQVTVHGTPLYRVIFKNGTLAWVDLTGQITDIQLPTPAQNAAQASSSASSSPATAHYDDGNTDN